MSARVVTYGWLGDAVINKTMADADIKYAAVVDALGRITNETFSNISDSQSFISNSYGYTTHSGRVDERNNVDYTFDTLGKLTAEDSTSYTSDILGNPTNASDDGLIYAFDNEDRVVDVDNASGDVASYSYDRLGRRAKKTVNGVDTNFVYDIFGNVIAEYEDGEWTCDYVYGGKGEAVYMQIPQTTTMNTSFDNFVNFIDAWLCYPDCTQDDLQWDINDDDQINLIDWAAAVDANDFENAFTINGRHLLTDFHNSVIGKVNTDGSVDEISCDAWGSPSYTGDLEGLSVLWNGYYFDDETCNYYLRNRYYSPLERRFITQDPHGINPDGNWNNIFRIEDQYKDGFGLQVYAGGDPVNNRDDWGLGYCGRFVPNRGKLRAMIGNYMGGKARSDVQIDFKLSPNTPKYCDEVGFIQIEKTSLVLKYSPDSSNDWLIDDVIPYSNSTHWHKGDKLPLASLEDAPGFYGFTPLLISLSQDFETCAICLKGCEKGANYGCVTWGHEFSKASNVKTKKTGIYVTRYAFDKSGSDWLSSINSLNIYVPWRSVQSPSSKFRELVNSKL